VLEEIERYIDENLSGDLSLEAITRENHISKSAVYRMFKEHLGNTVSEYVALKRVEAAVQLLMKTDLSVEEISEQCGFGSAPYFVSVFKRLKGLTPLQFRKQKFLAV